MRDVARFLIRLRSFVLYSIGMGLTAFGAYGFLTWVPAFMGRVPGALIFYFPSVLVSSVTLGPITGFAFAVFYSSPVSRSPACFEPIAAFAGRSSPRVSLAGA